MLWIRPSCCSPPRYPRKIWSIQTRLWIHDKDFVYRNISSHANAYKNSYFVRTVGNWKQLEKGIPRQRHWKRFKRHSFSNYAFLSSAWCSTLGYCWLLNLNANAVYFTVDLLHCDDSWNGWKYQNPFDSLVAPLFCTENRDKIPTTTSDIQRGR